MSTQGWKSVPDAAGVYQNDGRYRIRVKITAPKSKERQKTLPEGTTLDQAATMREELRAELRTEAEREIAQADQEDRIITLADYAEEWIEVKSERVKASTLDKYLRHLSGHVLPDLGHLRLDELTRSDVDGWVGDIETRKKDDGEVYSTATVDSWWRVLRSVLRDAHADGYLDDDPTHRVRPPDTGVRGRRESGTLSADQLNRLLVKFEQAFPRRYPEALFLAHTGVRPGEMYALEWDDLDIEARKAHVHRAHWRGNVGTTKTDAPREVPLSEAIVEALDEHREYLMRQQHPGLDEGLVFPADHGGYRYATSIRDLLGDASQAAKLDIKVGPQVLRRTLNTLALKAGVDRIHLRSIIGHSSEQMTERYAGVPIEDKREALGLLFEQGGAG